MNYDDLRATFRKRAALVWVAGVLTAVGLDNWSQPRQASAGEPENAPYSAQWSRTAVTKPAPIGRGCRGVIPASTAAYVLTRNDGTRSVYSLPLQLKIVNTATSAVLVCATQDPTPVINTHGYFSADSDSLYAAGEGICQVIPAGVVDFVGVFRNSFNNVGLGYPPGGGRRGTCSSNGAPCFATSECESGGTCTLTQYSNATLVATVMPAGSGSGTIFVCEVN